jgi:prepilin-type processing-associated H-X9-DG protein
MRRSLAGAAYSLLEVLVVIGIVSIVLSLLLPGVQMTREKARSLQCALRLRQLGLAVHQYESTFGRYPATSYGQARPETPWGVNVHVPTMKITVQSQLLPYLGRANVYDQINHSLYLVPDIGGFTADVSAVTTAMNVRVNDFLCPSDEGVNGFVAPLSYRANTGVGPFAFRSAENPDSANGFFHSSGLLDQGQTRPRDIVDGLRATAMFSERLVGSREDTPSDRNVRKLVVPRYPFDLGDADQTLAICRGLPDEGSYTRAGWNWLLASGMHATYKHSLPPNPSERDCATVMANIGEGLIHARSRHPAGANVCFGDGSVHWVENGMNLAVWRSLGTRDGRD